MPPRSRVTQALDGRCSITRVGYSSSARCSARVSWPQRTRRKNESTTMTFTLPESERYLDGKHAVVTGGSRGIGAAVAAEMVRRGAKVTIMGRSAETLTRKAEELRGEAGATVSVEECDVSDEGSVRAAFGNAVATLGPVNILVNNAGIAKGRMFSQTSLAMWNEILGVNLTGTFLCTSEVLPYMLEAKSGRIINIASTAGLKGYQTMSAYCASKHGVV